MPQLQVNIVRFVDEGFPGFLRCEFITANGLTRALEDKVPVLTELDLWSDSSYPQPGKVGCEILESFVDATGRELVSITIARPWGLETLDGETEFVVERSQVLDDPAA